NRLLYWWRSNTSKEADFETVFATLVRDGIAALIVQNDTLFNNGRERLGALAVRQGIPVLHEAREHVGAGSLISYGSNRSDHFRQARTSLLIARADQSRPPVCR